MKRLECHQMKECNSQHLCIETCEQKRMLCNDLRLPMQGSLFPYNIHTLTFLKQFQMTTPGATGWKVAFRSIVLHVKGLWSKQDVITVIHQLQLSVVDVTFLCKLIGESNVADETFYVCSHSRTSIDLVIDTLGNRPFVTWNHFLSHMRQKM